MPLPYLGNFRGTALEPAYIQPSGRCSLASPRTPFEQNAPGISTLLHHLLLETERTPPTQSSCAFQRFKRLE